MNRFTVTTENAQAFEALWLNRESNLKEMEGFVEFHMLKGPEVEGRITYASHTVWASEDAFSRLDQKRRVPRVAQGGQGHGKAL